PAPPRQRGCPGPVLPILPYVSASPPDSPWESGRSDRRQNRPNEKRRGLVPACHPAESRKIARRGWDGVRTSECGSGTCALGNGDPYVRLALPGAKAATPFDPTSARLAPAGPPAFHPS